MAHALHCMHLLASQTRCARPLSELLMYEKTPAKDQERSCHIDETNANGVISACVQIRAKL